MAFFKNLTFLNIMVVNYMVVYSMNIDQVTTHVHTQERDVVMYYLFIIMYY